MLLSSCVVWRYRTLEDFRAECPGGDPDLQRLIVERFDDALAWLESLGPPVVWEETGNPRTIGKRFDPRGLTEVLVRAAGDVRLETPFPGTDEPLVLATGGFQGDDELVGRYITPEPVLHRANPWSAGDGLRHGTRRGAARSNGLDEFYGRAMPAPPAEIPGVPLRRARAAVRQLRARSQRGRRGVRSRSDLLGRDRPRPGDRAPARRPRLVRRGRADARDRDPRPHRLGHDRGGARGRRDRSDDGRARLRSAGVLSLRRPRRRGGHAYRGRTEGGRPRARARRARLADRGPVRGRRRRRRDRRRAATRAGWRPRSSSALPPPKT